MMNVTRTIVGLLTLGCFMGVGCSSDSDSGSSSGFSTGLPSGKKLGDLTEEEAKSACEKSDTVFDGQDDDSERAGCVASAPYAVEELTLEACNEYVTGCLAEGGPSTGGGTSSQGTSGADDCANASAEIAGCEATVGEWEGCMNASISQFNTYTAGHTCENAVAGTLPEFPEGMPAACAAPAEKCPQLFGGEGSSTGGSGSGGSTGGNTGTGGPTEG